LLSVIPAVIKPEASFFKRFWIPACQAVAETTFCHPEFISGSYNLLFSLDAETSSALHSY